MARFSDDECAEWLGGRHNDPSRSTRGCGLGHRKSWVKASAGGGSRRLVTDFSTSGCGCVISAHQTRAGRRSRKVASCYRRSLNSLQMKQSFLLIIAIRDIQQRELAQHLSGAERKVEMVIDRRVRERRIRGLPSPVPVERRRSNRRSLDISPLLSAQGWAPAAPADAAPGRAGAPPTEGKPAIVWQTRALGWIALGTIIAAAIALRGYWLFQLRAAMDGHGWEYPRISQNLLTTQR